MEDVIHQCVECDYGIGQAEWHDQELEGTKASYTSHLGVIFRSNVNLVVTRP